MSCRLKAKAFSYRRRTGRSRPWETAQKQRINWFTRKSGMSNKSKRCGKSPVFWIWINRKTACDLPFLMTMR